MHFDNANRAIYVRTHDGWILAKKIVGGVAQTAEGELAFDPDTGEWRRPEKK